jgi:hypothetical protein
MDWHDIPNWNGWYQITRDGQIRISSTAPTELYARRSPGDEILTHLSKTGYWRVNLKDPTTRKYSGYMVHRLLMMTFSPVSNPTGLQINHKDGNKANNTLSNLEWCTHRENLDHAWRTGLRVRPNHSILTPEQVIEIRKFRATDEGLATSLREIGDQYGISSTAVWRVIRNRNWTHLL